MPAIIFDCDGVLADTERDGHLPAFNQTFREFGLPVQWSSSDYASKLQIGGGKERMTSLLTPDFIRAAGLPDYPDILRKSVEDWHRRKTEIYTTAMRGGSIPGRPGIARLVQEAQDAVVGTRRRLYVRTAVSRGDPGARRRTSGGGRFHRRLGGRHRHQEEARPGYL